MKQKNRQSIWWALLVLALLSISVFIFAPLGLVSSYVGGLAPDSENWIGIFFSLGLSLSIITMSGISYFRNDARWKFGVGAMAVAEGTISLAVFALKVDVSSITSVGGLFGIVVIQELTIFLCGSGLFVIINQIRNPFASERTANEQRTKSQVANEQTNTPANHVRSAARGDVRRRIIESHKTNPELGVTALANKLGVSKAFVSEVLKAERQVGFHKED